MDRLNIENVMHTITCSSDMKHLSLVAPYIINMAVCIKKTLIKDNPSMLGFDSRPFKGLEWRKITCFERSMEIHTFTQP